MDMDTSSSSSSASLKRKRSDVSDAKDGGMKDSSASSAPSTSDSTSGAKVDLGYLLSPLSREDLERFMVLILLRHPQEIDSLIQLSRAPLSTQRLTDEFSSMVSSGYSSAEDITANFETQLERAADYIRGYDVVNAITLLQCLTEVTVSWYVEENKRKQRAKGGKKKKLADDDEQEEEEKKTMESFFAMCESTWQDAINAAIIQDNTDTQKDKDQAPDSSVSSAAFVPTSTLSGVLVSFTKWRAQLTDLLGPIFDEQISSLKKKMKEDKDKKSTLNKQEKPSEPTETRDEKEQAQIEDEAKENVDNGESKKKVKR